MLALFSKRLIATARAAFVVGLISWPAQAGGHDRFSGLSDAVYGPGYHGRYAGATVALVAPPKHRHVNVYRGGQFDNDAFARSHSNQHVTIYRGGADIAYLQSPDYIEGLEVVMVTRGAGIANRTIDAICIAEDGHEMPAARVQRAGGAHRHGVMEVFRCEGSFTLRAFASHPGSLANGNHIVCASGRSLWVRADGAAVCKPKQRLACWSEGRQSQDPYTRSTPGPDKTACTEAELRHEHGTGPVVVAGTRQADHPDVMVTRGMNLTGGVGYAPF